MNAESVEALRLEASRALEGGRKAELGQVMTPLPMARFMASLFHDLTGSARLLDPGAGIGSLTAAFMDRWRMEHSPDSTFSVTAYECETRLLPFFKANFFNHDFLGAHVELVHGDFIEMAVRELSTWGEKRYTHAILNPPYAKLASSSKYRRILRQIGIETVNLYSAFVALAILLLEPGGELVAIIPRSWCNGPYYRPFRKFILAHASLERIHLFESRKDIFRDDKVLQENVIVHMVKGKKQGDVTVSTSLRSGDSISRISTYPFSDIVKLGDEESFVHIPDGQQENWANNIFTQALDSLGVEVSTGPVVDFRLKEHLVWSTEGVPLLYPIHIQDYGVVWPKAGKKPSAIVLNDVTRKWLMPNGGFYVAIKRFSSKEERRRVVAGLVNCQAFKSEWIGFENHLNILHAGRCGLPEALARGFVVVLNSTVFDQAFRLFSGHTQVNSTDLRFMLFPNVNLLEELGRWWMAEGNLSQEAVDNKIGELCIQELSTKH